MLLYNFEVMILGALRRSSLEERKRIRKKQMTAVLEAPFVQHCSIVVGHSRVFSKIEEGHRMSKCPLQLPDRVETLPSMQVLME